MDFVRGLLTCGDLCHGDLFLEHLLILDVCEAVKYRLVSCVLIWTLSYSIAHPDSETTASGPVFHRFEFYAGQSLCGHRRKGKYYMVSVSLNNRFRH